MGRGRALCQPEVGGQVDHPVLGRIELPGPTLRFDGLPPREHTAPPALGQDNDAVLAWLADRERER